MFKSVIAATPLTTETANGFFAERIVGDSWNRDYSFLATLRALLNPRMPQGETLYLSFKSTNYSEYDLQSTSVSNAISILMSGVSGYEGTFRIHNFTHHTQACNTAWMETVKSSLETYCPGWHRIDKVTLFFRKTFYVLCFVNPEKKSVVIFTDNMDVRKFHYLQAGIPAFLPWYFNQEDGVTEIEMELLQSLRERTSQHYEDCIARISEQYDFKTARVRQLLAGFETRYEQIQCDNIRTQLEGIIREINNMNDRIGQYLKQQRDYQNQLLGLEMKIEQSGGDSEIMEYFLCNDHLVLIDVTNTTMKFVARDYLTYFDEDMARRIINNETSYVYRPNGRACNNYIPAEDMKMLMTAIFLEQKLRIKFCAAYEFNLDGNVRPLGGYAYGYEFREYMPNPHINRYNCMGNYSRTINECLRNRNYIGALEQSIASCKSLNFGDSPVMSEFMRQMYGLTDTMLTNNRCIELPNGRVVTPKEAIEYLKSQKEEEADG